MGALKWKTSTFGPSALLATFPHSKMLREIFEVIPRKWRGIGSIAASGFGLRPAYRAYDAELRFGVGEVAADEPAECISGLVLQGIKKPHQCPAFGSKCTPERPLGAPMVSSEGACAAYYRYRGHHFRPVCPHDLPPAARHRRCNTACAWWRWPRHAAVARADLLAGLRPSSAVRASRQRRPVY